MDIRDLPPLSERRRDEMLTLDELGAYWGMEADTLRRWLRPTDGRAPRGPRFYEMGDGPKARIKVLAGDAQDYMQSKQRVPGTEGETPAEAA